MPITRPSGIVTPILGDTLSTPDAMNAMAASLEALLARLPVASYAVNTNINVTTANTPTSLFIPFPAGRFTAAPVVVVSTYAHAGGGISNVGVTGISTTGCTLWVTRNVTGSVGMYAIAQQNS